MIKALNLIFSLLLVVAVNAQTTNILWIGNSYTNYNNLPTLFKNLAMAGGDSVEVDSNTPGGFTLGAHATNPATIEKISQGIWDYVIIQAQSQEPSFPPNQVQTQTLPYAIQLDSLIHAFNPCAKTVYYMTWGRKFGDESNCGNYPPLCTFEGMTERLKWGYKTMAEETESIIAPVGISWQNSRLADSTINLWANDNSHPALAGSYLAACTFYSTIFRKPALGIPYYNSLESEAGAFLQEIADMTVNDSLEVWNIGRFQPVADFSFSGVGLEYAFQHEAMYAESYYWDFGDGTTSELPSPVHTYSSEGIYEVQLIAEKNCVRDTTIQTINTSITGIAIERPIEWRIFPNPASNQVMIQSVELERFHIAVYDTKGKLVKAFDEEGSLITLDFSSFEKGIYQIVCSTAVDQKIFRIMKD